MSISKPILQAFEKPTASPSMWLMRQAGRYLAEYRRVREQAGSFLDLCYSPKLAAEVTLQPIRRFGFDAAILFSDILVIPDALGREVRYLEGEGPRLEPIDVEGIDSLAVDKVEQHLAPVIEAVGLIRSELPDDKALIGFCGAPWTVATYMIAGRGTPDQAPSRSFAARDPVLMDRLIDRLVESSIVYLVAQLKAGADLLQLFDSWSGVLGEPEFERWCIKPARAIVDGVRAAVPGAKIIGFPKGAGLLLERYVAETGVDAVGIDWTVPLGYARNKLQPVALVQGNLDPIVLREGGTGLDEAVDRILTSLTGGRFIFNLGHGILPDTPVAHVEQLVARVRRWQGAAA